MAYLRIGVLTGVLVVAATGAKAQGSGSTGTGAPAAAGIDRSATSVDDDASKSMNPAARGAKKTSPGYVVPGSTGTNPYSGKSVGVPLQPNDLGSPEQRAKE